MTPRHLGIELSEFCQALPETSYVSLQGTNGFLSISGGPAAAPSQSRMLNRQFLVNGETYFLGARHADRRRGLRSRSIAIFAVEPGTSGCGDRLFRRLLVERPRLEAGAGCDCGGAHDQHRKSIRAPSGSGNRRRNRATGARPQFDARSDWNRL